MAAGLRPNSKAVERLTLRLKGRPGVVRAAKAPGGKGVTFITRAVRAVEALVEGATVFHETGMIYLRARVGIVGPGIGLQLSAVSFCAHALERLVERSDIDLQAALLPQVDAEAQAIFRGWDRAPGLRRRATNTTLPPRPVFGPAGMTRWRWSRTGACVPPTLVGLFRPHLPVRGRASPDRLAALER